MVIIALAIIVHKITKRDSNEMLLFFILCAASAIYDLISLINIPGNKLIIEIANANNKNFFIVIFELMSYSKSWFLWLSYLFALIIFAFLYFKMKQMEEAVFNAITQAVGMGETVINSDSISKQINVPQTTILKLFNIFKSSGKIPYNVDITH